MEYVITFLIGFIIGSIVNENISPPKITVEQKGFKIKKNDGEIDNTFTPTLETSSQPVKKRNIFQRIFKRKKSI